MIGGEALPETRGLRNALEPLLLQYNVDMVFVGHYHQYERSCRLARGECNPQGPVHLTVGMAGPNNHLPWTPLRPAWNLVQNFSHGHTVIDIMNETHTTVEALAPAVQLRCLTAFGLFAGRE